ncbi:hypothetical protein BH11BAC1_BH11BAC1_13580 [soil metagenome]
MKIHLLLLLFMINFSVQAQVTFQKTIGGTGIDIGYSICETIDGGYVITGSTESFGAGNSDVYLIKLNEYGDSLWTKTFGGIDNELGTSVQQTTDGGYIIVGSTYSFGAGHSDIYLIRTDSNGDSLWTKTFGRMDYDDGYSVQKTSDGGFIIIGNTSDLSSGSYYDVFLIKTDANGDSMWTKTFGGTDADFGYSIQQTSDSGYIISGVNSGFNVTEGEVYLIKTDSYGDSVWTKSFGGSGYDWGASVQQTSDGGYIIGGATVSFGAGNYDIYLIKTDSNGDSLWTKTIGSAGEERGSSIQQTTDGGFIITGFILALGAGNDAAYLVKTDGSGNLIWTKTFGGPTNDFGFSGIQTTDGGYIITGYTESFGAGNADIYIIKTDANGNSGCNNSSIPTGVFSPTTLVSIPIASMSVPNTLVTNPPTIVGRGGIGNILCTSVGINEILEENSLVIFPNPANSQCTIHDADFKIGIVEIFNFIGEKMYNTRASNCGLWTVDCRLFPTGIYFVNVINENGNATQKLIVQH